MIGRKFGGAGKGHETYQILAHETIHFDDRETARRVLESLGYSAGNMSEPKKANGASAKGGFRGKE